MCGWKHHSEVNPHSFCGQFISQSVPQNVGRPLSTHTLGGGQGTGTFTYTLRDQLAAFTYTGLYTDSLSYDLSGNLTARSYRPDGSLVRAAFADAVRRLLSRWDPLLIPPQILFFLILANATPYLLFPAGRFNAT